MEYRLAALSLQGRQGLKESLVSHGAYYQEAEACAELFDSVQEALPYISTADDGKRGFKSPWQEYWSLKYRRYYYCNDSIGFNSWDMPGKMKLIEWLVDVDLYRVTIKQARALMEMLLSLMNQHHHEPDRLWACLNMLAKLMGNISSCNNTIEKYRTIKMDNVKIQEAIGSISGAFDVLMWAGFKKEAHLLVFPDILDEAGEKKLAIVNAKLFQLNSKTGFTGSAKEVDDHSSSSSSTRSKHSSKPGFRYQDHIYECSNCHEPINDGTDWVRTRGAEGVPRGEFRYECQQCKGQPPSEFNLCESCWDKHTKAPFHNKGHSFAAIHPHESQHGLWNSTSGGGEGSSPWGSRGAPPSGSALRRLAERTGVNQWL